MRHRSCKEGVWLSQERRWEAIGRVRAEEGCNLTYVSTGSLWLLCGEHNRFQGGKGDKTDQFSGNAAWKQARYRLV